MSRLIFTQAGIIQRTISLVQKPLSLIAMAIMLLGGLIAFASTVTAIRVAVSLCAGIIALALFVRLPKFKKGTFRP